MGVIPIWMATVAIQLAEVARSSSRHFLTIPLLRSFRLWVILFLDPQRKRVAGMDGRAGTGGVCLGQGQQTEARTKDGAQTHAVLSFRADPRNAPSPQAIARPEEDLHLPGRDDPAPSPARGRHPGVADGYRHGIRSVEPGSPAGGRESP